MTDNNELIINLDDQDKNIIRIDQTRIENIKKKYYGVETVQNTLTTLYEKEEKLYEITKRIETADKQTNIIILELNTLLAEYKDIANNFSERWQEVDNIEKRLNNKQIELDNYINEFQTQLEELKKVFNEYNNILNLLYDYDV